MFEYKVIHATSPKEAQDDMNDLASQGWKVISVVHWGSLIITLERKRSL